MPRPRLVAVGSAWFVAGEVASGRKALARARTEWELVAREGASAVEAELLEAESVGPRVRMRELEEGGGSETA